MRHLLSIADLTREDIEQLHEMTDVFAEVSRRSIPKVPALRGKNVVWLFYEDSTRTRLSFEQAAKRLSADTMTFSVSSWNWVARSTVQGMPAAAITSSAARLAPK